MPVFNLTLPMAVNAMLEEYPAETLKPGDVLITNDPWLCAGHLFDIAIAAPVFRDERLVAIVGIVGHVTDIGGTKDSLNAQEIYEEGLQIPPMKLFREGRANEDLFRLIRENIRDPDQVVGDIHALVSASRTGSERLLRFMEEYGMHDLEALAAVIQGRAGGPCARPSAGCRTASSRARSGTTAWARRSAIRSGSRWWATSSGSTTRERRRKARAAAATAPSATPRPTPYTRSSACCRPRCPATQAATGRFASRHPGAASSTATSRWR